MFGVCKLRKSFLYCCSKWRHGGFSRVKQCCTSVTFVWNLSEWLYIYIILLAYKNHYCGDPTICQHCHKTHDSQYIPRNRSCQTANCYGKRRCYQWPQGVPIMAAIGFQYTYIASQNKTYSLRQMREISSPLIYVLLVASASHADDAPCNLKYCDVSAEGDWLMELQMRSH